MATNNLYRKHFWFEPSLVLSNFGVEQGWTSQSLFQRHLGDVNGDGTIDIVGIGYAGVYVSTGFSAPRLVSSAYRPDVSVTTDLADVNGDRRADLIDFSESGMSVAYGRADTSFSQRTFVLENFGGDQGWTSQEETPRLMADVNGDGKADVIGFGYAGTLVSLSIGVPFLDAYTEPTLGLADFGIDQGWNSNNLYPRAAADVNGDGWADIIGFGDDGVSVSLSNGDGTFAEIIFALENFGRDQGWSNQDEFPRLLGDVNRDGSADIVGFGLAGVYVAYGQSDGTFLEPNLDYTQNFTAARGWASDDLYHRELVDIGNNGLLDLVGFGYAGVYFLQNFNGFPPG